MLNKIFAHLRRRMTIMYSLIFGLACLFIVAMTCGLVWLGVMQLEKEALQETAEQAATEYLSSLNHNNMGKHGMGMMGHNHMSNQTAHQPLPSVNKNIIRFIQSSQGIELLDPERTSEAEPLLTSLQSWPQQAKETSRFTIQLDDIQLHYLGTVLLMPNQNKLYIFKDMSSYYALAHSLLSLLTLLLIALFGLAVLLSWWLAGKNLSPIENNYLKQQQFASDASHELRTPLNVLLLAVRALSEDTDSHFSSFAQKNLSIMAEESSRLQKLTEELLLLTRSDNNRLITNPVTVNLSEICRTTLLEMTLLAAEKNIMLDGDIKDQITIKSEADSLKRLLIIFIDNAIKYSPTDSDIRISLQSKANYISLTVADHGPGISDTEKNHVTDRFYRSDKIRNREGGTGLGLALALAIVQQHKGKLEILDNQPCGTIMKVTLPQK